MEYSLFYFTVALLMARTVNFLIADEISEEKTEELQPDRKEKQYAYTEEEGNQRSALSSRMIAEDDVS